IEVDGLGMADMQIAVRLRREARLNMAVVPVGLQVVHDGVANEVRWRCCRNHRDFSFSIACSMRRSAAARPTASSVPNKGGAVLRPHTATRIGSNIWPALMPSDS